MMHGPINIRNFSHLNFMHIPIIVKNNYKTCHACLYVRLSFWLPVCLYDRMQQLWSPWTAFHEFFKNM